VNQTVFRMKGLFRILSMLLALPVLGAAGFMLVIPKISVLDALYLAVTTITTVGNSRLDTLGPAGRIFVMVYLIVGIGTFTYGAVQFGEQAYRAKLHEWLARRKMDTTISSMRGHFIICGFGRMGRAICQRLAEQGVQFVVVDRDPEALAECRERGWPWLVGDATHDETLLTAGIHHARALSSVLGLDSENVYLTLSAHLMAPELQIVARASDEQSVPKLMKAGANRVVGLHDTGAAKMAQLMINPNLDRLVKVFEDKGLEMDMAEIEVASSAAYAGQLLGETDFRNRGITVVAIRRADGELLLPPDASTRIAVMDMLIFLGRSEAIRQFVKGSEQVKAPESQPPAPTVNAA